MSKLIKNPTDNITYKVIGLAMDIHSRLGPGLKEEMYQKAMEDQLNRSGLNFEPQKQVEVYLDSRLLGLLFIDIVVENTVILELKALSHPLTNNEVAQVITYLKVHGVGVGILLNFGRKYLEYKRIFPPKKISEIEEKDLRFGVRMGENYQRINTSNKRMQYIR